MDLKILEERPNPLLKRTEYRFEVGHAEAATPSRDAVRGELAKAFGVAKDRVVIERMHARFGAPRSRGMAALYESPDAAKAIVRTHILVRNGLKEKESKGAAAAAPAAAAPPAPPAAVPEEKAG